MRVAVILAKLPPNPTPDEGDTLAAAQDVAAALEQEGHTAGIIELELARVGESIVRLGELHPDVVINLIEDIGGLGELNYLGPALLEVAGYTFTGCSSRALTLTQDKTLAKTIFHAHGIPTPAWCDMRGSHIAGNSSGEGFKFLLKPVSSDSSIGIHEDELKFCCGVGQAVKSVRDYGGKVFAERFIDGREFNISILEGAAGAEVLPPAEINFIGYGDNRPRVVGYKAKWIADSYEYSHTPRTFDFPEEDRELLKVVSDLALRCWSVFDLSGYARVDLRVDKFGNPWVLEINANPGIGPDSGFVAAAQRSGLSYRGIVSRLLSAAVRRKKSLRA